MASLLVGCAKGELSDRPSIVLVTLDTLRADHLGCYGYPRETSPFLDRMAATGARFTNAVAACSHTGPAHASIFTGLSPMRHGLVRNGLAIPDELDALAELLDGVGYQTVGVTPVGFLSGLQGGFDDFLRANSPVAEGVIDRAIEELRERDAPAEEPPLFLWLHFFDAHTPYRSGETRHYREFTEASPQERERITSYLLDEHGLQLEFFENGPQQMLWLASNYDAEIRRIDEQLSRFYEFMEDGGLNEDTLWIFVADHGEGLGDHLYHGHDRHVYEEQLSIPLIVHTAGAERSARVVDQLVRHVDLLPTMLDWAAVPSLPDGCEGTSLLPLAAGDAEELPIDLAFSQRRSTEGKPSWVQEDVWSLRVGRFKYIRHGLRPDELYDLDADPRERDNLVEREPDVARELETTLTDLVGEWARAGLAESVVDGDGHLEELRALGYVDD